MNDLYNITPEIRQMIADTRRAHDLLNAQLVQLRNAGLTFSLWGAQGTITYAQMSGSEKPVGMHIYIPQREL
jgi:hypothetical protein